MLEQEVNAKESRRREKGTQSFIDDPENEKGELLFYLEM